MVVKQELGLSLKTVLAFVALCSTLFTFGSSWALQKAYSDRLYEKLEDHTQEDTHMTYAQKHQQFVSRSEFTSHHAALLIIEERQRKILESQVRIEEQLKK